MTPKQQLALLEAEAKAYSESIDKQIGHEKHRRIKTAAYYGYLDAAKKYQGEIRAVEERMERMAKALEQAVSALGRCYDVNDYPANGTTSQDEAIRVGNTELTDYNIYKKQFK